MVKCGNVFMFADNMRCVRKENHSGLHRNTVKIISFVTIQWGDNEGTPKKVR